MISRLLALFRRKPPSDDRWRYVGIHIAQATDKAGRRW